MSFKTNRIANPFNYLVGIENPYQRGTATGEDGKDYDEKGFVKLIR